MNTTEVIRAENLTKIFKTRESEIVALKNINLSVKDGEFLCIVGPSGCGKTTLLRIFAGLEKQTLGKVYLRVKNTEKPLTAMVFQGDSVFPWMKVTENVEYGLRMRGVPTRERREIALKYLKLMGLEKFAGYYPHQLSGGMKQRINVARAFASDPEILLMDEPFGALDEQNRLILQQELLRIWEGSGKTTVFITHSIDEALLLGDRIIVMTAQPGRIKAILEVGMARPRDMLSIKSSPPFVQLYREIWELLREEVLKARDIKLKK
ncbi:ABC transporter ATP-binding protein [Thermosediminibacter litoriperuensis]|uniref:NitT/TauT family transport system ATP-binding protein n=1 Tax=Thermosediminibacter litoriperuensis TaxID=291989 RepID=A0A5S5AJX8_9FIRM|nr:ABC transporter ATP-binding protein [Thermosediminibacter litoriperuensis]TYP50894.1 NitT/TauT family transport system ATP-binding protein [Thermosediminibacter litoriperuensis]